MTLFDYTNSMREQGCVKVVLIFPCMVNVVLLRYETVLQRILTIRCESCLEIALNSRNVVAMVIYQLFVHAFWIFDLMTANERTSMLDFFFLTSIYRYFTSFQKLQHPELATGWWL